MDFIKTVVEQSSKNTHHGFIKEREEAYKYQRRGNDFIAAVIQISNRFHNKIRSWKKYDWYAKRDIKGKSPAI